MAHIRAIYVRDVRKVIAVSSESSKYEDNMNKNIFSLLRWTDSPSPFLIAGESCLQ